MSIQNCNMYENINKNDPTLQIQCNQSHIYDQQGQYMAIITTKKLHCLWNKLSHNKPPDPIETLHPHPPPQDFAT